MKIRLKTNDNILIKFENEFEIIFNLIENLLKKMPIFERHEMFCF